MRYSTCILLFFFFNDHATTEKHPYLHTLSLHDALPISPDRRKDRRPTGQAPQRPSRSPLSHEAKVDRLAAAAWAEHEAKGRAVGETIHLRLDRKSTRLNSSH